MEHSTLTASNQEIGFKNLALKQPQFEEGSRLLPGAPDSKPKGAARATKPLVAMPAATAITKTPAKCSEKQTASKAQVKSDGHHSSRQDLSSPKMFELTGCDVLCGRHKLAFNHEGNRRFRSIVSGFLGRYLENTSRTYRSRLNAEIIRTVQGYGGHFLTQAADGQWSEISEKEKRNKVGHALRDAAASAVARRSSENKQTEISAKRKHSDTKEDEHDMHPLNAHCALSTNIELHPADVDKILNLR